MASRSYLTGSFPLTAAAIEKHVPKAGPGAFVLGFRTHDTFTVQSVGRGDEDLAATLGALAAEGRYQAFKFVPAASAADAFAEECHLFHEFGEARHLDNKSHPPRPAGANVTCPGCSIYGMRDWRVTAR